MSGSIASTTSTTASAVGTNALGALSSNYNDFLTLLTTQLQNQDPSSPMDTSQFTSELAQFAGVQQEISTNTNLSTLIQLAQGQQVLQGSSLLGKQVELNSTTLPLQSGAAHLDFTAPTAEPMLVTVTDQSGNAVFAQTVNASAGANGWDWNGQNSAGVTQADGSFTASVTTASTAGTGTGASTTTGAPLSFTTRGTVTQVTNSGGTIDLDFGSASVGIASVARVS